MKQNLHKTHKIVTIIYTVFWATLSPLVANDAQQIIQDVLTKKSINAFKLHQELFIFNGGYQVTYIELKTIMQSNSNTTYLFSTLQRPLHMAGTSLLMHEPTDKHKKASLWIYSPILQKIKRMPEGHKRHPILGSNFNYDDLMLLSPHQHKTLPYDTYTFLGEETIDKTPCFIIKGSQKNNKKNTLNTIFWIDKHKKNPIKILQSESNGLTSKLMKILDFRYIEDVFFPTKIEIVTYNGTKIQEKSILKQTIDTNQNISSKLFSLNQLKRGVPE